MTTQPIPTTTDDLIAELEYAAEEYNSVSPGEGDLLTRAASRIRELEERQRWIPVSERLPEKGVTVMVYTPPQPGDYPDDVRIDFDGLCPESDDAFWLSHGEHYEHWCCIAKGGDGISWSGPSEQAPYTHWKTVEPPP